MVEHLQGPISLMESSITDSSLGLTEELCRERGDCLNSAEDRGILGMRVGMGVGSDHSGPFSCDFLLNIHSTRYYGAAAPAQVMDWVLGTQHLVPALEKSQQAPGSSIID